MALEFPLRDISHRIRSTRQSPIVNRHQLHPKLGTTKFRRNEPTFPLLLIVATREGLYQAFHLNKLQLSQLAILPQRNSVPDGSKPHPFTK
jgi:hypothetical protein